MLESADRHRIGIMLIHIGMTFGNESLIEQACSNSPEVLEMLLKMAEELSSDRTNEPLNFIKTIIDKLDIISDDPSRLIDEVKILFPQNHLIM